MHDSNLAKSDVDPVEIDAAEQTAPHAVPATTEVASAVQPFGARDLLELITSRWVVKSAFLVFFVLSVVQLLRFESYMRGAGPEAKRPEAVAGILPIGHFTSFFGWVRGGGWDYILPAGLVIILAAIIVSLLFKRGFCGWICPVGTVWEGFFAIGRKLTGGRTIRLPKWLDIALRAIRYVLAAFFMFILFMVPVSEAVGFRELPYMWIADLKIIHLMAEPLWIAVALFAAAVSMLFGPVWCRYLCPVGGLYSTIGLASPCTIERDPELCTSCHRCSRTCHAFVEPEKTTRVLSADCDGCMDCVKVCPVDGCLEAKAFSRVRIAPWVWPVLVVGLWLAIWAGAKVTGNWDSRVSPDAYRAIINSGLIEQRTPTSMDQAQ